MANITLAINSNWSTCSDGNNTGSAPGASDNVYLNGYALTLDAATCTCALIKACQSNGTTFTTGTIVPGIFETLNANLWAGLDTLMIPTAGTRVINGTVTGGSTTNKYGIHVYNGGVNLTITSAMGGSGYYAYGLYVVSGDAVVSVQNATGGSQYAAHGVNIDIAVSATIGVAKGGSIATASGIIMGRQSGVVNILGLDYSSVGPPLWTPGIRLAPGLRLRLQDLDGNLNTFYGNGDGRRLIQGLIQ
jgi:hypothetical protein